MSKINDLLSELNTCVTSNGDTAYVRRLCDDIIRNMSLNKINVFLNNFEFFPVYSKAKESVSGLNSDDINCLKCLVFDEKDIILNLKIKAVVALVDSNERDYYRNILAWHFSKCKIEEMNPDVMDALRPYSISVFKFFVPEKIDESEYNRLFNAYFFDNVHQFSSNDEVNSIIRLIVRESLRFDFSEMVKCIDKFSSCYKKVKSVLTLYNKKFKPGFFEKMHRCW